VKEPPGWSGFLTAPIDKFAYKSLGKRKNIRHWDRLVGFCPMKHSTDFWMQTVLHRLAKVGIRFPCSVVFISGSLLVAGLALALVENTTADLANFFTKPDPLTVAVLGIGISFAGVHFVDSRLDSVVQGVRECFDVSNETYDEFVRQLKCGWCNHYGSLLSAAAAIFSLTALASFFFPRPLFLGTTQYQLYDWYLFGVYLMVMAIFGSLSWAIVAFTISLRKIRMMPVRLDSVRDLRPLTNATLILLFGWFVASGLVYLVLPLPYAISASFLGFLAFVLVQVYLHEAIVLKKKQTLAKLHERYRDAQRKFEEASVDDQQELSEAIMLSTIRALVRDVDETQEWPINYSQLVSVAATSTVPLVVRYALTRTL
jgi:hypothetical protein